MRFRKASEVLSERCFVCGCFQVKGRVLKFTPSRVSRLSLTLSSLQGKVRIRGQQAGTERTTSPHSFQMGQPVALTHGHRHSGDKNITPPLPSLKPEQTTQKARPPAAGTPQIVRAEAARPRRRPAAPRPPPWTPCPRSPARPGERDGRRGRPPPSPPGRRDAPHPTRCPHLRRGRTASGRRAWRAGQSYSPGEPSSRASAERRLRFRGPAEGARGPAGLRSARTCRRRRRRFPGKEQTLVKTSLLNRPCCLPAGERQGRATQADTHPGQWVAA